MAFQNLILLVCIGIPFGPLEAAFIEHNHLLINASEILCATLAKMDPNSVAYLYRKFKEHIHDYLSNSYGDGNCILLTIDDINPITHQISVPIGWKFRVIIKSRNVGFTRKSDLLVDFEQKAKMDGFNQSLVVGNKIFHMKEMNFESNYTFAMAKCLQSGGILPMEKTDEFVDQMSNLAGDSITPRFISLAYESTTNETEKYLMWTIGKTEWKDGESLSNCPRCKNWSFGNGSANLWAKINPFTKFYEIVTPNETVPKFYCQYLGGNLATHKNVVASSTLSPYSPSYAVSGVFALKSEDIWHSSYDTPKGEWISIELGASYFITNVLFLARMDEYASRHNKMEIWIDGPEPQSGAALNTLDRNLCGIYKFYQRASQLSGVECQTPTMGRRVTILNPSEVTYAQFIELGVYGFKLIS